MKLKTTLGLMLTAGVLALAGCGSDDDNGGGNTGGSGGATGGTGGTAGTAGSTGGTAGSTGGTAGSGGSAGSGPLGKANPPTPGAQIDRAGRAAISSAMIETFSDDATKDPARDAYNSNSDPSTWAAMHKAQIKASLGILDALDGNCGNQLVADQTPGDRYDFLATVLSDDQLYVLTTEGTCGVYLGLEADIVGVPNVPANCGGRMPADDVIARSYSVLANGSLSDVDDTITVDDKPASNTFPFLSAP